MKLAQLTMNMPELVRITSGEETEIRTLTADSRAKCDAGLFFCIRGGRVDAHDFAPQAVQRGAVALLVEDGWVYNADGTDYTEGVRYKKVTAEQAGNYAGNVTLADGTILMPLSIEWASSEGNPVSELLKVMLAENPDVAKAGMKINQTVMTFTELLIYIYRDESQGDKYAVKTYSMYNLATGFVPAYDYAYNFAADPESVYVKQGYNTNFIFDKTLDDLSMNMVYGIESDDTEGYLKVWREFIARWNELLPEVPLYSNVYVTMYPDWLEGYTQDSFWDFQQAIVYCTVAE